MGLFYHRGKHYAVLELARLAEDYEVRWIKQGWSDKGEECLGGSTDVEMKGGEFQMWKWRGDRENIPASNCGWHGILLHGSCVGGTSCFRASSLKAVEMRESSYSPVHHPGCRVL